MPIDLLVTSTLRRSEETGICLRRSLPGAVEVIADRRLEERRRDEADAAFEARVWEAVSELVDVHTVRAVAVVTHSLVLNEIVRSALRAGSAKVGAFPYTGITHLRCWEGNYHLCSLGDVYHLEDPLPVLLDERPHGTR